MRTSADWHRRVMKIHAKYGISETWRTGRPPSPTTQDTPSTPTSGTEIILQASPAKKPRKRQGKRKSKRELGCTKKWGTSALLKSLSDFLADRLGGNWARASSHFDQFTNALKTASVQWVCSCKTCVVLRGHGLRVYPSGTVSKTHNGRTDGQLN